MEGIEVLGFNGATIIAQIVNFVVLFGLLYLVAYKPVLKMMDQRSGKIRESLEQAEAVREKAARADEEVKKQLEDASREGHAMVVQATHAAEEVRHKAQQDARLEAEKIIHRAQVEIQRERDEALDELRKEFADLTIMAAEKVIDSSLDKEKHRELIEKTLESSSSGKPNEN